MGDVTGKTKFKMGICRYQPDGQTLANCKSLVSVVDPRIEHGPVYLETSSEDSRK